MPSNFPFELVPILSFSRDTNIASISTALGLKQSAQFLQVTGPLPNQQIVVSHMEPFRARLDIEIVNAPKPVGANRTSVADAISNGDAISYTHFVPGKRRIPLSASFLDGGNRTDGWCELGTFLSVQADSLAAVQYYYSCNGVYPAVPYGDLNNGIPQST